MAHPVLYHCSHLESPRAPLPPGYASSFSDLSPLNRLYFCEECDAVRCDQCIAIEVASYYCPNCLFDVPSANVRGDKNRCARSCFACPQCCYSLTAVASDLPPEEGKEGEEGSMPRTGPPYFLACTACKWSSREVGWLFDKPSSIAGQAARQYGKMDDGKQAEFDAIKDHLEGYIQQSAPQPARSSRRFPTRNIAHMSQSTARALRYEIPGMAASSARRGARAPTKDGEKDKSHWDELGPYDAKSSWRAVGLEHGTEDVDEMAIISKEEVGHLEKRWANGWDATRMASETLPQRMPLQAKLTKRCPHPTCRHILIQPDTKTVRLLIKMVASNYLPAVEIGRRRRRIADDGSGTDDDLDRRRRERRRTRMGMAKEEDEDMSTPLLAGQVYSFQLAVTNPLYDPIKIRLGAAHQARPPVPANNHIHLASTHFSVGALKDAWAYDDEDDDAGGDGDDPMGIPDAAKGRMSLGGSARHRSHGVEQRGNVTKVGVEVEVARDAEGPVEFDLEVRFTYRADEGDGKDGADEFKTFTLWCRVHAGEVAPRLR